MDRIGRYKIARELGHGAMGVVYHAMDPNIGRPVAIKTIRLSEVSNPQERARLKDRLFREARSAGMLSHPGIVTIYDVDQQGELAYIAMEFVDGPTLDEVLNRPKAVSSDQIFAILGQTAVALDYAHQKGIVHRDIKPANIMLDAGGFAKITDFGIAKITASEQFTMTGTIVGTPHYMAPEQVQGLAVDGRADQFSLGVIAFEMLTGEKPFTGEQLTTVVYKIVAEEPPPAQRLNASLGPQIEAVLRKVLAKKPEARYRNCQEFVNALEAACQGSKGWKSLPRGGGFNEPTLAEGARPLPPARPPRRAEATDERERRKVGLLPVLFAVVMAAALVGLIAWQATPWLSSAPAPVPAPPPAKPAEPVAQAPVPQPAPQPEPPEVKKPSALEPPKTEPASPEQRVETPTIPPEPEEEKPAPKPEPRRNALYPILVATDPPGAVAALDGRADSECKTPCSLQGSPGKHRVAVTLPGHLIEHREVQVASAAQELPLITLRTTGGVLMLSTAPPGASVFINGKQWPQNTPAQINLAAGTYTVAVEKGGLRATERIEIRNGGTTYRKIPLQE